MPVSRSSDFRSQFQQNNETDIYYGIVVKVDPEKQVMDVKVPGADNVTYSGIPINQACSPAGWGVRAIPIPHVTYVLLHHSVTYEKRFYHVGYFYPSLEATTQNRTNTKQGQLLFQRYLEPGEVQLVSLGQAELLLKNDGSVLVKAGSGNFLKLSEIYNTLEGSVSDVQLDNYRVHLSSGRTKRATTPEESNIIEVLRDDDSNPHIEFRVDVGSELDSDTGAPRTQKHPTYGYDIYPTVASLTVGSKVFDLKGEPETILKDNTTSLVTLFKTASGLKIGVDEEGSVYIVNSATDSHIKFTCNKDYQNNEVIDKTEVEVHINKSVTKITEYGELQYTNTYDKDGNNGQVNLTFSKKGEMLLELSTDGGSSKNTVEISEKAILLQDTKNNRITLDSQSGELHLEGSSGSLEKSVLGETLKTVLEKLMDALINHNHPTGVGPSGPPINAAEFTTIKTADIPTTLSQKVKNN